MGEALAVKPGRRPSYSKDLEAKMKEKQRARQAAADAAAWDHLDLTQLVRDHIEQHQKGGSFGLLRAFESFHGHKSSGENNESAEISIEEFGQGLLHVGLDLPRPVLERLFAQYDTSENGKMSYHEFCRGVMGEDYAPKQGTAIVDVDDRDHERMSGYQKAAARRQRNAQNAFWKNMSPKKLTAMVREKIESHMSGGAMGLVRAFETFHGHSESGEITKEEFRAGMLHFGLELPTQQLDELFHIYSSSDGNTINFREFCERVMMDKPVARRRRKTRKASVAAETPAAAVSPIKVPSPQRAPVPEPFSAHRAGDVPDESQYGAAVRAAVRQGLSACMDAVDDGATGVTSAAEFRRVLEQFGLVASPYHASRLCERFRASSGPGLVRHEDFLAEYGAEQGLNSGHFSTLSFGQSARLSASRRSARSKLGPVQGGTSRRRPQSRGEPLSNQLTTAPLGLSLRRSHKKGGINGSYKPLMRPSTTAGLSRSATLRGSLSSGVTSEAITSSMWSGATEVETGIKQQAF